MTELFDDPEIAHWTPLASPFDETAARASVARVAGSHPTDEPPIAAIGKGRSPTLRTWAHDRP
ncbi:hypothetical protein OG226_43620 [Streptomyces sp. NBC_01261]|uniref:hypothetical protein n=1 Tax=Streptomyces sp. NBC_01261 TaxID=2903802 RepID=UPI002E35FDEE|nr:hypothetical protein [Streptomyces sp. NBC_01261]